MLVQLRQMKIAYCTRKYKHKRLHLIMTAILKYIRHRGHSFRVLRKFDILCTHNTALGAKRRYYAECRGRLSRSLSVQVNSSSEYIPPQQ